MSVVEIELHDRRLALVQRVQLIQDVVGVLVLFPAASARLKDGVTPHVILGAVEASAIIIALLAAARELKSTPQVKEAEPHVDLTNLMIGVVLLIEHSFRVAAGRKMFSPLFLTGVTSIVLAFARPILMSRRRRFLRIDENGFLFRSSPFRKFRIDWATVQTLEEDEDQLRFKLHDGTSRTVALKRYSNREDLRTALIERAHHANLNIHLLKG